MESVSDSVVEAEMGSCKGLWVGVKEHSKYLQSQDLCEEPMMHEKNCEQMLFDV